MNTLEINQVDSVHIKIDCERSAAKELSQFFTFTVPNFQYTPAYKNKLWDGQIRLFNIHTHLLYGGLQYYVTKFAEERNYKIIDNTKNKIGKTPTKDVEKYINEKIKPSLGSNKIKPFKHQVNAITYAINHNRCLLVSPTGSGKSLIIYSLIRYYESIIPEDKKILIIVPTTGLVAQMYNDFKDYSSASNWDVNNKCHSIYAGQDKVSRKKVIISTWQSIYKMPQDYFEQFGAVFGDECHLFKSKSLTAIMSKLTQCPYRIGTTGTLDGSFTHKLVIEGLFGMVYDVVSTKKLMEEELLSELEIECITLQYTPEEIQEVKRVSYQEELKWIVGNNKRNQFLSTLSCTLHGNSLVLFNFVESHGVPLYEMVKKQCGKNRQVFFIHGGTDTEQREEIRQIIDKEKNAILIASYGTCSTGINIRNIHNVIFASPSKSVVRVLQSIGRGLRRSKTKDRVKLYDISDNLCYLKYKNHTMKHLNERIKIYSNENFKWKSVKIQLRGFGK
jgi:superfamily II DNA or RNA helicase